jgi:hypothetical protein
VSTDEVIVEKAVSRDLEGREAILILMNVE